MSNNRVGNSAIKELRNELTTSENKIIEKTKK